MELVYLIKRVGFNYMLWHLYLRFYKVRFGSQKPLEEGFFIFYGCDEIQVYVLWVDLIQLIKLIYRD